jgi:amino acid adenylation domain-containing protein
VIPALLAELRARDIHVWVDGDQLQCNAPAGRLTPELRDRLQQRKGEILEFLRGPAEPSFSQQRLWFLDQVDQGGVAYVMAEAVEMRGTLDVRVLEQVLNALVIRHESLRTVFVNVEGRPLQVVSEPVPWALPVTDLSGQTDQQLAQRMREEAARGFDLARGPLFRAQLYRLAPDDHVLLLTMHHIVSDGWSMGILSRELSELYGKGEAASLPALPVQYRGFARWQRSWLQGEALDGLLAYWRARLAGAPQVLELPADRPRPAVESNRGANYSFTLPLELTEALRALARREGATLYMTLLSGFALLLSRYSGQQDLLIGTPVANRSRAEIEGVVGFFVNTLVLRADLSGNPSASEFLARMREVCLDAYAHQDLPFDRLVEEMRPERDLSRNPLFQVMFALQNVPPRPFELPGLALSPVDVARRIAQVDLTLNMQETADGLIGIVEYSTDLFEETTIARMAGHLRWLLEGMAASPERGVWDLPLLTEPERHQLLFEWNDTAAERPVALLHDLFAAQAARTPDAVAVVSGRRTMTYGELDRRANQLAHALRSRDVGRGARVGLCVERGTNMLAALLGILKTGAAYVPLDPAFPDERLRFMAEDAQLALLVSTTALAGSVGLLRERQLLLDADARLIDSAPDSRLPVDAHAARPEDPAYVIYTSGSTGKPKGVIVPHRAVVNFLTSMARKPGLTAEDVLVAVTTLSFDIAVLELCLPLTLGATIVLATRDEAMDSRALSVLLERHRATVMQATPTTWRLLLEAGWAGRIPFKALVGGEAMPKDLADQLIARGVELWNMYGPTETTVWSTCARIADTSNGITIGRPIANTTVYILDEQRQLCPIGVPGELCIGGEGVSLGYWNRPELTAERFVPDPFSPGATLYRTGDRARWRNDGNLEHLGRVDFQVKLRGYRIELGEIEAAIARHPAIRQVAVLAREDAPGDKRLAAYLVAENAPADLADQLRALLRSTLPEYMVPARFVSLDALPLTPNGKIDRKSLPSLHTSDGVLGQSSYVAPRNDLEISLATVWERVLGVPRVGITDSFFDLGGNSLSTLRLIFEMEQATGVQIDLGEVFRFPTIAGLVGSFGPKATKNASVVVPLQREGDGIPVFCICGINIYKNFAESLGQDQPVYGVYVAEEQAIVKQVIRGEKPMVSIERLVEAYYKAIARFRPQGPYRLAGLSFGGILAIELASKMRKSGAEVELVFLLDAVLPQGQRINWAKWFSYQAAEIIKGNARKKIRRLFARLRDRIIGRGSQSTKQYRRKFVDEAFASRQEAALLQAAENWRAHQSTYDFRTVLFRASDNSMWGSYSDFDEDYGWRRYLGDRLSIVNVVGGHCSIIEPPNVTELGLKARQFLGLGDDRATADVS